MNGEVKGGGMEVLDPNSRKVSYAHGGTVNVREFADLKARRLESARR